MQCHQILIVEDEANLGTTLNEYLNDKGYKCRHVTNCESARNEFNIQDFRPTVVLMDIGLPDGDGIELAKEFRKTRQDFVLIFLSAQNDPETKYQGLEMGAEDYITKPFDLRELMIRLEKALSNHKHLIEYQEEIKISKLKIRFKKYEVVSADNTVIPLGQKECAILELLYRKSSQVVSRDEIIEKIWGANAFPSNRTVDNYIVRLRKWMETDATESLKIKSVRGVGYQLIIKV
ncbi:MAG: response regulator transcription factor [Halobacteriovoraceae bacterium]|jgi:two-component system, OmpR family, alkaline phosphatase synthesis response regulator PhoP|nr:response regulator transcription factor [Halobacteriovoraceae bacterium]